MGHRLEGVKWTVLPALIGGMDTIETKQKGLNVVIVSGLKLSTLMVPACSKLTLQCARGVTTVHQSPGCTWCYYSTPVPWVHVVLLQYTSPLGARGVTTVHQSPGLQQGTCLPPLRGTASKAPKECSGN